MFLTHMLQGILLAMFIISLKISSDWAVETVFVVKEFSSSNFPFLRLDMA